MLAVVAVAVVVDLVPEVWVAVRHRAAAVASSKSSPAMAAAEVSAAQAAVQAEMQEARRGAQLEQQACHEAPLEQQAWPRQLHLSRARLSAPCWYLVSLEPSLAEEVAAAAAVELWVAWARTALEMLSAPNGWRRRRW
ncbi:hypothetical protein AK812_SmicGene17812 [Symbiodinium microadriaticum]|uniref:Uncharacterized protein n=1 Tax=Symbiodinium microadriaticum TaxID=2951 RepID=A0A1Q9DWT1_SYMMI|nr:hypothetical protein AK812_SmicGene17812 [Symbiodinium microadriaticum]